MDSFMGFMSTQSRPMPGRPGYYSALNKASGELTEGDLLSGIEHRHLETTTSYRSGKGVSSVGSQEEEDEDALLSGGVSGSLHGRLKQSQRHESPSSFDTGHPFSSVKYSLELGDRHTTETFSGPWWAPQGWYTSSPFSIRRTREESWQAIAWPEPPTGSLEWYGSTAIARCKPDNPTLGLLTTLGELRRDGLPDLPGLHGSHVRRTTDQNLGSEYLNYEFAWKPLIADIVKGLDVLNNSRKIIAQATRNSGARVRRQYRFPEEKGLAVELDNHIGEVWSHSQDELPWTSTTDPSTAYGDYQEFHDFHMKTWFSGEFTYFIPQSTDFMGRLERYSRLADKLVGTRDIEETLWNLQPWSWLVDWKVNVGDLVSNLSSFQNDGLLLRYGYVMQQYSASFTRYLTGPVRRDGGGNSYVNRRSVLSKRRERADPFGFSTKPSDFTDRQWNILGALGLSKGPKSLF